jgi:hypothetical protein
MTGPRGRGHRREQSSGTFVALATETPELKARSGARVEKLEILGHSSTPSLPGGMPLRAIRNAGWSCPGRWRTPAPRCPT